MVGSLKPSTQVYGEFLPFLTSLLTILLFIGILFSDLSFAYFALVWEEGQRSIPHAAYGGRNAIPGSPRPQCCTAPVHLVTPHLPTGVPWWPPASGPPATDSSARDHPLFLLQARPLAAVSSAWSTASCLTSPLWVSSLPSVTCVGLESTLAKPQRPALWPLSLPCCQSPLPCPGQQGSWVVPSNVTSGLFCTASTACLRPLEETRGPEKKGVAQGGTAN